VDSEEPIRLRMTVGALPDRPKGIAERAAVRAVIRRGQDLLLVHSAAGGDFKFPGGGIEAGESVAEALAREVREECGREVAGFGRTLLVVDERRTGQDPGWILQMTSTYLECRVGGRRHPTRLDAYEEQLGFRARWMSIPDALAANEAVLAAGREWPWVQRETRVLRLLLSGRQ
jgi:ADP-ribose pyrophosphatase YjhB (NUDIX family)